MAEITTFLDPKAEKQIEQYKADLKEIAGLYGKVATGLKSLDAETKKVTKDQKDLDTITIEGNKLLKQRDTYNAKQSTTLKKLTKDVIKAKDAERERIAGLKAEGDAYKQLDLAHKKAIANAKKLAAQYGINSKQAKAAAEASNKLDTELKNIDKSLGQNQREVGKYGKVWDGVKGNIMSFVSVAAVVGGALKLIWSELQRSQSFQDKWNQGINASRAAMDTLTGSIKQAIKGNGGFQDFNKRLDESIAKSIELTKRTQELTRAQISQISKLNRLAAAEEIYRSIADDATLSFQQREEANEKARNAAIKRLDTEVRLTGLELDNNADLLKNKKANNEEISNDEYILNKQLKIASDNAIVARKKADADYLKFKRELDLDDFEQQLDFIFDVGDKRKTANEKLINDESLTAAKRIAILNDTNNILNESFDDQIGLFESENKLQIDRNKLLTLNNKESFEYARGLGLSERATNRLLEVIRERIAATSDMDEAQKALNISIMKGREDQLSLTDNLIDNEKKLAEATLTISKEITDGRKEQYDKDVAYAEDAAAAKMALNKQILDSAVSSTQEVGNILFDLSQSQLDRQLETIGAEYNARILAAEGNEEVQAKLAEDLAKKQNEIKREQAQSDQNQALFNIALNTFQGISAAVAASPLTFGLPFSAFVGIVGAAQAAAVASQPLPEFFMGTSDTPFAYTAGERGSELMIKQDGSVELTPNKKTVYAGKEYEHAQIIPNKQTQEILANRAMGNDNKELLNEMRLTRKAIERSSPSIHFSRNVGRLNQVHHNRKYKVK